MLDEVVAEPCMSNGLEHSCRGVIDLHGASLRPCRSNRRLDDLVIESFNVRPGRKSGSEISEARGVGKVAFYQSVRITHLRNVDDRGNKADNLVCRPTLRHVADSHPTSAD